MTSKTSSINFIIKLIEFRYFQSKQNHNVLLSDKIQYYYLTDRMNQLLDYVEFYWWYIQQVYNPENQHSKKLYHQEHENAEESIQHYRLFIIQSIFTHLSFGIIS